VANQPNTPIVRGASDLHGVLPEIDPCDVLVLAGDLLPLEMQADAARSCKWFSTVFAAWLDGIPATEVVAVAGNHDFVLNREVGRGVHRWLFGANWTYLQDAGVRLECGLSVWGTAVVARHSRLGVQRRRRALV